MSNFYLARAEGQAHSNRARLHAKRTVLWPLHLLRSSQYDSQRFRFVSRFYVSTVCLPEGRTDPRERQRLDQKQNPFRTSKPICSLVDTQSKRHPQQLLLKQHPTSEIFNKSRILQEYPRDKASDSKLQSQHLSAADFSNEAYLKTKVVELP